MLTGPQRPKRGARVRKNYPRKLLERWPLLIGDKSRIPNGTRIIEIPLSNGTKWLAWYLKKNPVVDEVVQRNNWRSYPVSQ